MLTMLMLLIGCGAFVVTLPRWLPGVIVALRMRVFAGINGDEGIQIPGRLIGPDRFKEIYSHPAAGGRSRGAALSDLFWYWLSPGPQVHQEHLEPGALYDEVARTTRDILGVPTRKAERLAARCAARTLDDLIHRPRLVRLRDVMMPIWAEFYYELVFGERCPPDTRELIVANARDVVTALKCCGLRHMDRRHRLTRHLIEKLTADHAAQRPAVPALPAHLSIEERALYLQGTFFNTAVVQQSEAMAHLLMISAQHQEVQLRLAGPGTDRYLDHVIEETLRLYPLFGIAHRITSADIHTDGMTIPAGSVLCFDYQEFQRTGFDEPGRFRPERWGTLSTRSANHIPFGVAANRPCPAWRLTPITMRIAVREVLMRFDLYSTAEHSRSIPNRGPCLLVPRGTRARARSAVLAYLRLRDRWEDVWRSIVQLVLGTYMVWDARRQRLCERHFTATSSADRPQQAITRGTSEHHGS